MPAFITYSHSNLYSVIIFWLLASCILHVACALCMLLHIAKIEIFKRYFYTSAAHFNLTIFAPGLSSFRFTKKLNHKKGSNHTHNNSTELHPTSIYKSRSSCRVQQHCPYQILHFPLPVCNNHECTKNKKEQWCK